MVHFQAVNVNTEMLREEEKTNVPLRSIITLKRPGRDQGSIDSVKSVQQSSAESETVDAILSLPPPRSLAKSVDAQHNAERPPVLAAANKAAGVKDVRNEESAHKCIR